jgi:hypothetical protein
MSQVCEARYEIDGAIVDVGTAFMLGRGLQREFFGGRIPDGNDVTRIERL